jgi:hypothetical protein
LECRQVELVQRLQDDLPFLLLSLSLLELPLSTCFMIFCLMFFVLVDDTPVAKDVKKGLHTEVIAQSRALETPIKILSAKLFTAKFSETKRQEDMGVKRPRDFILTLEEDDAVSQSESEPEVEESTTSTKKRKTDENLNPDFEFDGFDMLEGVKGIDDDGWGFEGVTGMRQGAGVDLDGIIARRRENLADDEEEDDDEEKGEDDEDKKHLADDSEPESNSSEEFNGFNDDDEIGIFFYFLSNILS